MRKFISGAAVATCLVTSAPALAQSRYLDVKPQPLDRAVVELGRQADIQILAENAVTRLRMAKAVKGSFPPADALQRLIAGSGLVARQVGPRTYSLALPTSATPSGSQGADNEGQADDERESGGDTAQIPVTDIVVTGTLIKGIAPVGTNVIGISDKAIKQSGATSAQQLLSQVPQISNFFNRLPAPSGDVTFPSATPVIRNLPGINSTLTLLNGRRLVNLGIIQAAADPGTLPVAVMQRVEVVPDGGSATYGSDAVGGTINFIPRRSFDGFLFDGSYGFASDYEQHYLSGMAGKDWGNGSAYVAYSFNRNDALLGRDRGYVSQFRESKGSKDFRGANCSTPNIIANGISYAGPNFGPGSNRCDTSDNSSFFPKQERHSVFGFLTQDLDDKLRFENQFYFSTVETTAYRSQHGSTVTIDASNPYFRPIGSETRQTVQFAYDPAWGQQRTTRTRTSQWGISPKFILSLANDWQVEASANYGRGYVRFTEQTFDAVAQSNALRATTFSQALNPYDIGATNRAVLDAIHDYENYATSKTELAEGKIVANGALLTLPGGDVRVAVGTEFHRETMAVRNTQARIGAGRAAQLFSGDRNVISLFGEVVIPIFGIDNGFSGMRRLTLSGAARYDRYDDVGSTVNPKIGLTWVPIDGLTIRGNYGTSFNAPQLGDTSAAADTRAQVFNSWGNIDPTAPISDTQRRTVLIAGGNLNLRPQTADTFSIGADIRPVAVPGLTLSATFYSVKFKNLISITPVFDRNIFLPAFARYITINPTIEQARQLLSGFRLDGIANVDDLYANGQSPYMIADARRYNLGIQRTQGIDYSASYDRDTSFGSINLYAGGSYTLVRSDQPFAGAAKSSAFDAGAPRLTLVASAGATVGGLTARVQYSRTNGYDLGNYQFQTRVSAFDPINAFLSYDLDKDSMLGATTVSLNVQNIFNRNPPYFNGGNGYTNGSTFGRLVVLGLRKQF